MADHLPRLAVRAASGLHAALYRSTRGRVGRRLAHNDMLLLTTTGRHSGRRHTVPLLYLRDDPDLVVVASFGGHHHHPDWYLNLRADPRAVAQVKDERFAVLAHTANPQERALLWPRVVEAYEGYDRYQGRTDREIPVVLLRRA